MARIKALAAVVATVLLAPPFLYAQENEPSEAPHLSGSIEGGYWSGSKDLDDRKSTGVMRFTGKGDSKINGFSNFHFEGRIWNQDSFNGDDNAKGEFREAWVNVSAGDATEFRLGKQLLTWGRADGINPTDLVNAKDFTRLVPEESDQKLGTWLLKTTHYFGNVSATGVWILGFDPHRVPIPSLGSGVALSEEKPKNPHQQGAIKVETTGGEVDASLSYFDGYDHTPDLKMVGSTVVFYHPRIKVIGADAARNFGRFGFRAEASYTFQDNVDTSPLPRRQDVLFLVLGVDRSFFEYLNVNVQYIGRYLSVFSDPRSISDPTARAFAVQRSLVIQQQSKEQHGMSTRISHKWFHETLEAEIRAVTWFAGGDYLASPRISYAISDTLKVSVGADIYRGPADSIFGLVEQNSLGFAELKWSF